MGKVPGSLPNKPLLSGAFPMPDHTRNPGAFPIPTTAPSLYCAAA